MADKVNPFLLMYQAWQDLSRPIRPIYNTVKPNKHVTRTDF